MHAERHVDVIRLKENMKNNIIDIDRVGCFFAFFFRAETELISANISSSSRILSVLALRFAKRSNSKAKQIAFVLCWIKKSKDGLLINI